MAQEHSEINGDIEMGTRGGSGSSGTSGQCSVPCHRLVTASLCSTSSPTMQQPAAASHSQVPVNPSTTERRTERSGTGVQIIPRVRKQLSVVDENSFTPHFVPIGPYHVGYSSPWIEEEKLASERFLLQRQQRQEGGGLAGLAKELEPLVRASYPSSVGHMTTEEWSTMLLRDGCYLLGCMVDYKNNASNDTSHGIPAGNDQESGGNNVNSSTPHGTTPRSSSNNTTTASTPTGSSDASDHGTPASSSNATASTETANDLITSPGDNNTVVRDTVLLADNQIPFFVLQEIHERVRPGESVLEHISKYVQELLHAQLYISKQPGPTAPAPPPTQPAPAPAAETAASGPPTPPPHLLHLLHSYLKPTRPPPAMERNASRPRTGRWRRATEYYKHGNVRFERRAFNGDDEQWTFLDVLLQGDTLWAPRLRVDGMTWTVLRNLMALEEHKTRKPVTAYCVFMSQVACKVEDVEFLQQQGILEQFLVNDEEVAQGFANLCRGVVLDIDNHDSNYLKPYWHQLDALCTLPRRCMGYFHHRYCSRNPLVLAGFIFAVIVFIFEFAQVDLSIAQVVLAVRAAHQQQPGPKH